MSTTAARPAVEAWPEGVIARYLTVGGATVDTGAYEKTDRDTTLQSTCWGCRESTLSSDGLSAYASSEERLAAALRAARQWSQAHAERCRALPHPFGPFADEIGPRRVSGRYYSHVSGNEYEVLDIQTERSFWPPWQITVRLLTGDRVGDVVSHCTAWDAKRDRVLS
ncbi:hypothetical protein [Actinomadura rugatobispora]|uniref:Uncharacterized protein n=1 Tax=Actinomadura rugatobispora TaxID=1994 RepID=A0ABW0ZR36_9ACTN|nr:hypothetical protein GCM10010200_036710 [Actinomadura rugatobispora]